MSRIWPGRSVRILLAMILLLLPLCNGTMPFAALILGSLVAYAGAENFPLIRWTLLIIFIEVVYALDFGVISLSFVLMVGCFSMLAHWLNLRPWARESGWAPGSFLRTILVALSAAVMLTAVSVLIRRILYGDMGFWMRLGLALGGWYDWLLWTVTVIIVTVALRRADYPFRRRIVFGI